MFPSHDKALKKNKNIKPQSQLNQINNELKVVEKKIDKIAIIPKKKKRLTKNTRLPDQKVQGIYDKATSYTSNAGKELSRRRAEYEKLQRQYKLPADVSPHYYLALTNPWDYHEKARIPGTTMSVPVSRYGMMSISVAASTTALYCFLPDQLINNNSVAYNVNLYTPYSTLFTGTQATSSFGTTALSTFATPITYNDVAKFRTVSASISIANTTPYLNRGGMLYGKNIPYARSLGGAGQFTAEGGMVVPTQTNTTATAYWPNNVSSISNFIAAGAATFNMSTNNVVTFRWIPTPMYVNSWSSSADAMGGQVMSATPQTLNGIFFIIENPTSVQQSYNLKISLNYEIVVVPGSIMSGIQSTSHDFGGVSDATIDYVAAAEAIVPLVTPYHPGDRQKVDFRC